MTTDPTGCSFLSYRRTRAHEAEKIICAQREHGIPTWQDLSDLGFDSAEGEIRNVLNDPLVANAVLFITPEVSTSDVIRNIEAPQIFDRHLRKDGFFAVPVAAGGLGFSDLAEVLGDKVGHAFVTGWNIHRPERDPIDEEDASSLASKILDQRLTAIHRSAPASDPLRLEITTVSALAQNSGAALAIDLRHLFENRLAKPGVWDSRILPAFDRIVRALEKHGRREIIASGFLALPAAVALGAGFLTLAGIKVSWQQELGTFGGDPELWSLRVRRKTSGFKAEHFPMNTEGDIALLISVAQDVTDDFNIAVRQLNLKLRARVSLRPDTSEWPGRLRLSAGEASDLVQTAIDALRHAVALYKPLPQSRTHLFLAVPAGVAFMLGQLLNTFGKIQTYELVKGSEQPYRPAALFNPSE